MKVINDVFPLKNRISFDLVCKGYKNLIHDDSKESKES